MVRLGLVRLSLATLVLLGARHALAGPISSKSTGVTLTGNVEADFPAASANVRVIPLSTNPTSIGEAPFIIQNGWVSGWSVKDIRTSYDPTTDTLSVGFNTFANAKGQTAIVGDADGNGDPGGASAQMAAAGGVDNAHLGGHKSVAISLAADNPNNPAAAGNPIVVAGVPADKSAASPTGLDGFTVAAPKGPTLSLPYNFGGPLTDAKGNVITGSLAFDPSAAHPGFEFTINHFSKITGLDPFKGFWLSAYAGSPDDVIAGEAGLRFTRVPAFSEQTIPEPATVLSWSLVAAGAAAFRVRRASKRGRVRA
jgi:hypothetical protein